MRITHTGIKDLVIIEPVLHGDDRGYFLESFKLNWFQDNVSDIHFIQDNESKSIKGVLRGLHFQTGDFAQANKAHEGGILYNDPTLAINWVIPTKDIILSEKDALLPTFQEWKANRASLNL